MEREPVIEIFEAINVVSEQAGGDVLLPLPKDLVEQVVGDDNDPKFATFVIESGWSKSKRFWGLPVFQSAHEQIMNSGNEPIVGYLGHIKNEDDPFVFPEIQFQWLASKLQTTGDKARLFTKAYVLPGTKARDYLKRGLAKNVSWRGDALHIPIKGGVEMRDFILESIDLARPRKAGMSARLVALTAEMSHEEESVKPEEIAALSENELRAHNPALVTVIETGVKTPLETKVTEMEQTVEEQKPAVDQVSEIRKKLGVSDDADLLEAIGQIMSQLAEAGKTVRDGILQKVLKAKFGDDKTRVLVGRMLTGEMEGLKLALDETHEQDDLKKVNEMVNNFVDKDEELKSLVSEMEKTPAFVGSSSDESRGDESGSGRIKDGYQTSNIRVRAVNGR